MKRFRVYIINLIGFNKTEANATIILLSIVLLAGILPRKYFRMSHSTTSTEQQDKQLLSDWLLEIDNSLKAKDSFKKQQKNTPIYEPFKFDPNLASDADLKKLGFKPYLASRIVNYRKAGGSFKSPEELLKIFGMDSALVHRLTPYIAIAPPAKKEKNLSTPIASVEKKKTEKNAPKIWMDLNLATNEELQEIRGIGPFYAKNILAYRNELGGFYSYLQLTEVYRMKPNVIDLLKKHTYISEAPTQNLPINSDSMKHLANHPYLNWNQARVIVNYRKQHGTFTDAEELLNIKIIDDSLYQKISPYISVEP
ncbi:MAG: helix-hairpin-helix domain-containing protein [Cytophagales bacterium]|nr:helix-hairpin-helix domain-containing protein [Cytophagales bacterium]